MKQLSMSCDHDGARLPKLELTHDGVTFVLDVCRPCATDIGTALHTSAGEHLPTWMISALERHLHRPVFSS